MPSKRCRSRRWSRSTHLRLPALYAIVIALAGCGGRSASSTVVPTHTPIVQPTYQTRDLASVSAIAARDRRTLLASSYTPDRYLEGHLRDGGTFLVFHSVCTGSADGHCQAVQVFRGHDSAPIWTGHFAGVKSFRVRSNGFTVTSVQYAPSDPLCCPSLAPITQEYRWTGKSFTSVYPASRVSP